MSRLSAQQLATFQQQGYVRIEGFAQQPLLSRMLEAAQDIARRQESGENIADALILPEAALGADVPLPQRT